MIVPIYKNYQEEKEDLGLAQLVHFVSKGLPFILDDYTHCPTYNTEKWEVEWILKKDLNYPYQTQYYNVRYTVDSTDKQTEDDDEEYLNIDNSIPDRFITFDSQEAF